MPPTAPTGFRQRSSARRGRSHTLINVGPAASICFVKKPLHRPLKPQMPTSGMAASALYLGTAVLELNCRHRHRRRPLQAFLRAPLQALHRLSRILLYTASENKRKPNFVSYARPNHHPDVICTRRPSCFIQTTTRRRQHLEERHFSPKIITLRKLFQFWRNLSC